MSAAPPPPGDRVDVDLAEDEFILVDLRRSLRRVGAGDFALERIRADPELFAALRAAFALGGDHALDVAIAEVCPWPLLPEEAKGGAQD